MEFVILASFMMLFMLGFFAITSSKVLDAKEEGNRKIAQDIAEFAYKEIETARSVINGYSRTFFLPQKINGISYTIGIIDGRELVVEYLGNEHVKFIPQNVAGNITKGSNKISKSNGIIRLN